MSSTRLSSAVTIVDSYSFNIVCINVIVGYCCRNCRVSRRLSRLTVDGCESVLSISLTLSTLIPHWPWDKTTLFSLVSVSSLRVEKFNVISQMSIRCILPYICFHNCTLTYGLSLKDVHLMFLVVVRVAGTLPHQ